MRFGVPFFAVLPPCMLYNHCALPGLICIPCISLRASQYVPFGIYHFSPFLYSTCHYIHHGCPTLTSLPAVLLVIHFRAAQQRPYPAVPSPGGARVVGSVPAGPHCCKNVAPVADLLRMRLGSILVLSLFVDSRMVHFLPAALRQRSPLAATARCTHMAPP